MSTENKFETKLLHLKKHILQKSKSVDIERNKKRGKRGEKAEYQTDMQSGSN